MPFYEVVYETGRNSVMCCADDDELLRGVREQHRRAKAGERGLASADDSPPAERIVDVLVYDKHPNDLNPDQTMSADVLEKEFKALVKDLADDNGVVKVDTLAVGVRNLTHPLVDDAGSQDSIFKMKEERKLNKTEWDGDGS